MPVTAATREVLQTHFGAAILQKDPDAYLKKDFAALMETMALMAGMKLESENRNVPTGLESVHTARVAGYFIEGHVPAEDIKLLLRERPRARGLAVPGLPRGAPGREQSNPFCETACTILDSAGNEREVRREAYNTLLVAPDGKTSVFARH